MTDDAPRKVSLAIRPDTLDRLRMPLQTVACWRLGDGVFRFDHKLIGPAAKPMFAEFWAIRDRHPTAPIALFGHADIKGDDDYNHRLGAERAQAVYGVLNGSPDLWYELFEGDRSALANLHVILRDYGLPHGEDGFGPGTFEAVGRYMAELGAGRRLEPFDYLDDGLHAMQSCSELNPVVRPSRELLDRLSSSDRARLEEVNRRVVAYFFDPGTYVGDRWPCPVAGAGVDGCRARLWSDAGARRATPSKPLQYWPPGFSGRPAKPFVGSQSTFGCRFYDRIARGRGCEKVDPWRPPEPPPPPPPPPPEPPPVIDPPELPPEPVEWMLRLTCEHDDHVNRRRIYGAGKDVLQLVPPSDGDNVAMAAVPETTVDWSLPGGTALAAVGCSWRVPEVVAVDPKPWDLLDWKPTKNLVVASKDGVTKTCTIEAYPHAQYSFDFERVREKLRDDLWKYPLKAWNAVGDFVADEFELKLLEKEDFGGHLKMQWREHPGRESGTIDYRAYTGYWFSMYADPLARCSATMSASLDKIFSYIRKIPGGRWLLDKIPHKAMTRLNSMRVEGSFTAEGGGHCNIDVDQPGRPVPSIGTDKPGASVAELRGEFVWDGSLPINLDELVTGEEGDTLGSLVISIGAKMNATMGFIVDVDDRRLGAYVEGDFEGVTISVVLELPAGFGKHDFSPDPIGAEHIDRRSLEFEF